MPVPSTGTFRLIPQLVASKTGSFYRALAGNITNYGLPNATSTVDPNYSGDNLGPKDSTSDALIAAWLNAGGGSGAYGGGGGSGAIIPARNIGFTYDFGSGPQTRYNHQAPTYLLEFLPDTSKIIFNPGVGEQIVDVLSGDFPSGFLATALRVRMRGLAFTSIDAPGTSLTQFNLIWNMLPVLTVNNPDIRSTTPDILSSPTAILGAGVYVGIAQCLESFGFSISNVVGSTWCLDSGCTVTAPISRTEFFVNQLSIEGEYITSSWSANIGVSPSEVAPNDRIIITDLDNTGRLVEIDDCSFSVEYFDLYGVLKTVLLPCEYAFRSAGGNQIILYLGNFIPYGGKRVRIIANVTSVEYTGSVTLATLNANLVDGSGIYRITKGKTNDTYYDRTNPLSPTTVDMKIPNPFIKTGYF